MRSKIDCSLIFTQNFGKMRKMRGQKTSIFAKIAILDGFLVKNRHFWGKMTHFWPFFGKNRKNEDFRDRTTRMCQKNDPRHQKNDPVHTKFLHVFTFFKKKLVGRKGKK